MEGTPVHCRHCGLAFATPSFFQGSAQNVTISNVTTTCPRCGQRANVVDGVYKYENGRSVLTQGPPSSVAVIAALEQFYKQIKNERRVDPELAAQVIGAISDIDPSLAETLNSKIGLPWFILLVVMIFLIKSVELSIDIDINRAVDQAYHLFEGDDPEAHIEAAQRIDVRTLAKPQPISADRKKQRAAVQSSFTPAEGENRHTRRAKGKIKKP